MSTKAQFLQDYRAALLGRYLWAQDDQRKLDTFMASVEETIHDRDNTWDANPKSDALKIAWAQTGKKGKATMKALRALP